MTTESTALPAEPTTGEATARMLAAVGASFAPKTWEQLVEFAQMMARSKVVPECYRGDPASIVFAVQMGAEVGLAPAQSLLSIALIEGRAGMYGDAPLAIVRRSGKLEYIREWLADESDPEHANPDPDVRTIPENMVTEDGDPIAWCEVKRVDDPAPVKTSFSKKDAITAKRWLMESRSGGAMPWKSYWKRMLKFRARGYTLRDVFGDVLKGLAQAEELEELRNVTPEPEAPTSSRPEGVATRLAQREAEVVTGEVERPLPVIARMIDSQIKETVDEEAVEAGVTPAELRALIAEVCTKPDNPRGVVRRSNALALVKAVRAFGREKAARAQAAAPATDSAPPDAAGAADATPPTPAPAEAAHPPTDAEAADLGRADDGDQPPLWQ